MDKRYIQRLADDQYEGEVREAMLEAIEQISDEVVLAEIERRIKDGDVEGAVAAAGVTAQAFEGVRKAEQRAFVAGARETVRETKIDISFEPGNPRAERRVDELHTGLIREVTDETRQAIRDEIEQGLSDGENPRKVARRIRGEWDKQAGRHKGGVIGLTRHQAQTVRKAREELSSGDPKQMRQYLGRKLRDRRHDRTVLKAINEGRALTQAQVDKMEQSYRRRWVQHRAETIARDQSLEALSMGQEEALDQAVDQSAIREQDILKEWMTAGDSRVRDGHEAIPSMNPGGVRRDKMFETWYGPMRRPRDRQSPGSVKRNTINCRCSLYIKVRRS